MQYVLPDADLSNTIVHMPVRAQTMLVHGYPVQSVAEFDYSSNYLTLEKLYVYDPSANGLDPYWLDPSGAATSVEGEKRKIIKAYSDATKDMKVHPIMHSNKYAMNLYPVYKA
jgi:hypothetical protein